MSSVRKWAVYAIILVLIALPIWALSDASHAITEQTWLLVVIAYVLVVIAMVAIRIYDRLGDLHRGRIRTEHPEGRAVGATEPHASGLCAALGLRTSPGIRPTASPDDARSQPLTGARERARPRRYPGTRAARIRRAARRLDELQSYEAGLRLGTHGGQVRPHGRAHLSTDAFRHVSWPGASMSSGLPTERVRAPGRPGRRGWPPRGSGPGRLRTRPSPRGSPVPPGRGCPGSRPS